MPRLSLALATLALAGGLSTAALAASPDFVLINSTGYQINEVYVSQPKNNEWGNDVMGKDALPDGSQVKITFNTSSCNWDIKVVYDDKDTAVWQNVNLCDVNSVTLFWDSKNQTTRAVSN